MRLADNAHAMLPQFYPLEEDMIPPGALVRREARTTIPTRWGEFEMIGYLSLADGLEHLALVRGVVDDGEPALVRVHSECLTGDVFGSQRCDCGAQLQRAMFMVAERGRGVILYMRQEGRGIGLLNKMRAYELQDAGKDTVEANEALGFRDDHREYSIAAEMLDDLGVRQVELLTNNPHKIQELQQAGLTIVRRVGLQLPATDRNIRYLRTKRDKMGHDLLLDPDRSSVGPG